MRDLGRLAVLLVLFGLALRWSLLELWAPDPLIELTGWQIAVWVSIALVVMLGFTLLMLKVVIHVWAIPALAAMTLSWFLVPCAFMPLLVRLDVAADHGTASRLAASVEDYASSSHDSYYRGARITTESHGIIVRPLSGSDKPFRIDSRITANASGNYPPVGAELSMLVHPGFLGVPWVSDLTWTPPPPRPELPSRPAVTDEDLARLREDQAVYQRMLDELRAEADASAPSKRPNDATGADASPGGSH